MPFDAGKPFTVVGSGPAPADGGFDPSKPFKKQEPLYYETERGRASAVVQKDGSLWLEGEDWGAPASALKTLTPVFSEGQPQAAPKGAPRASAAKRTLGERFTTTADAQASPGPFSGAVRLAAPKGTYIIPGDTVAEKAPGTKLVEAEREARDSYGLQAQADPWYRAPGGLPGKAAAGGVTLAGALAGSLEDPANLALTAVGGGQNLLRRSLMQGGVNTGLDVVSQGLDLASGTQDEYHPEQTAIAAGIGVAIPHVEAAAGKGLRVAKSGVRAAAARFDPRKPFAVETPEAGAPEPSSAPAEHTPAAEEPVFDPAKSFTPDEGAPTWTPERQAQFQSEYSGKAAKPEEPKVETPAPERPTYQQIHPTEPPLVLPSTKKGWEGRSPARIELAQLPDGKWASAYHFEAGDMGGGSPITGSYDSREEAISAAVRQIRDRVARKGDTTASEGERTRIRSWLAQLDPETASRAPGTPAHWEEFRKSYTNLASKDRYKSMYGVEPPEGAVKAEGDGGPRQEAPAANDAADWLPEPQDHAPTADLTERALDAIRSGKAPKADKGPSLLDFISRSGGLKDTGGELRTMDAERWHRDRAFRSKLVRENGRSLEDMAQRAHDAGYFPEVPPARMEGGENMQAVSGDALLEAIRQELAGKPRHAKEAAPDVADLHARMDDLQELLDHLGIDPAQHSNAEIKAAIEEFFHQPEPERERVLAAKTEKARLANGVADQGLIPGVEPVSETARSIAERLRAKQARRGHAALPEGGLFDETAKAQQDLFSGPAYAAKSDELRGRLGRLAPEDDGPLGARSGALKRAERRYLNRIGVKVLDDGPAGPRLSGLEGRWSEAVRALRYLETGDALGVLHHPDVGPIDVIWGSDRGGLKHILEKHPEVVADLPERLAETHVTRTSENRLTLASDDNTAVIRLAYDKEAKTWLLTAFESEGQGSGGRTDSAAPYDQTDSSDRLASEKIGSDAPEAKTGDEEPLASSNIGGLRKAPRHEGVSRAEASASSADTITGLAERLRRAMGLTHRQGRMTLKRALGEYHPKTDVIRTRAVHELDVLAHEGGHKLEYMSIPEIMAALKAHASVLKTLAYPGAPEKALRREGFAEWFRWYLTNSEYAKKLAPAFYDAFEAALDKARPAMLADLRGIQAAYQDLLKTSSADVLATAMVRTHEGGVFKRAIRAAGALVDRDAASRVADTAYTWFVDRLHPLNKAVSQLSDIYEANKGVRPDLQVSKNPYALARLAPDIYGAGHMDIMHGVRPYGEADPVGPGLADALEKALGKKFTKWDERAIDEFGAYLVSRRAVHEWARFEAGQLDRPPDKYTKAFHETAIRDFEAANPTWADAAEMVYEWNDALWAKEHDAGFLTEETYLSGMKDHPDYVPLQRDVSDKARAGGPAAQGSLQHSGGSSRFRGSTRDYINPVESMMRRAYTLNAMILRNDAFKALDDLAEAAGRGSAAVAERVPAHEMRGVTIDAIEALRKAADEAGVARRDIDPIMDGLEDIFGDAATTSVFKPGEINARGEPIIFVWREGKKMPLRLADGQFGKDMYSALTGMTTQLRSLWIDMAAAPARTLRYGVTASPEFLISNYIRDQIATWINTDVGFKPVISGAVGVGAELKQGRTARLYNSFGGTMGGANVASLDRARVARDVQALRKKGYAVRRYGSWKGLVEFTELSETGSRLGVFRLAFQKAKRAGMSDHDAALEATFAARDYMDFGRHGSRMLVARRLFVFLNASLQGVDKAGRVLSVNGNLKRLLAPLGKDAPRTASERAALTHAYKAWAKVTAIGAFGLGLRALYAKDPEYQEISDYLRATHWVAKIAGEWVVVPKPFELAALSDIMERAYERTALDDPTAWDRLGRDLSEIVLPPHEMTALSVPFQIAANRDHNGRPIIPDHLKGSVDPAMQYNAYTSEFGKMLGRAMHVSPAIVDYVVTGYAGSMGRYALSGGDKLAEETGLKPKTEVGLDDALISRRFIRDVTRSSTSQKEFWGLVSKTGGEMTRRVGTFQTLMNDGKFDEASAYLNGLKPAERAYVRASTFMPSGIRKAHPLVRATAAVAAIGDLRRDLASGPVRLPSGETVDLTPTQRRKADDALSYLAMVQMRNALIQIGDRGWSQKQPLDEAAATDKVRAVSPQLDQMFDLRMLDVQSADVSAALWDGTREDMEATVDPKELELMMSSKRLRSSNLARKMDEAGRIAAEAD